MSSKPLGVQIQELQSQIEIKNFEATAAVKCSSRSEESGSVEIQGPSFLESEGHELRTFVKIAFKYESKLLQAVPDPDKFIGLLVKLAPGATTDCHVRMEASFVNVQSALTRKKCFAGFRRMGHDVEHRGWNNDKGFAAFKEVIDESKGWLHDGALRIDLKLWHAIDDHMPSSAISDCIPQKHVCADLLQLFQSGERTDVVIKVKGEELHAHELILVARSTVFAAMLSSPMREGTKKEIVIKDLEMPAVRAAVEFLYSGEVDAKLLESDDLVLSILEVAHRYNINSLVATCGLTLTARLNIDAVAEWFHIADLIGSVDLRARCLDYMRTNISDVQATAKFEKFIATRPALLKEILASLFPPAKRQRTDGPANIDVD